MIKDKLTNAGTYYGLSERLKKGFEWLKNNDLKTLKDGKYNIDGEEIFANVQSYQTKDTAPFEAHRKYIDIQYMIDGAEKIGVSDYGNCSVSEPYNEEKDVEFLVCKEEGVQVLKTGEFFVFYPQDAHQPSLDLGEKKFVKKVIVKVAI